MIDYFKVLNVGRNASKKEIKEAYRKLAKRYHPDHLADEVKEDILPKFLLITKAYKTLIDDHKRKIYIKELESGVFLDEEEKDRKERAEQLLREATSLMRSNPVRAIKYFRAAITLDRNNPIILSYYSVALLNVGKKDDAYMYAKKSAEMDSITPIIFYNYAVVCEGTGRIKEAVSALKKCLKIDKSFKKAKALLDELNKNSFLGKIFKKGG